VFLSTIFSSYSLSSISAALLGAVLSGRFGFWFVACRSCLVVLSSAESCVCACVACLFFCSYHPICFVPPLCRSCGVCISLSVPSFCVAFVLLICEILAARLSHVHGSVQQHVQLHAQAQLDRASRCDARGMQHSTTSQCSATQCSG
jgi:hypothetical protein